MKKVLLFFLFIGVLSSGVYALVGTEKSTEKKTDVLGAITDRPQSYTKEMILGNILKGALEQMHYSKKVVNDDLSHKAFNLFIERIDYGKQFLLRSDVKALEAYQYKLDDELRTGNLEILTVSSKIMKQRVPEVEKYVQELLAKPFNFNVKENLEADPKKRDFPKDMKELKELWRKQIKSDVLSRLLDMKEGEIIHDKKENEKKKEEKLKEKALSEKEMEAKAREKVATSYKRIFKRLKKERKNDDLDKFYNAITRVYDPHTHYLIPEEKEDFDIDMSGKLEGIGAVLREDGQYIKVERVMPGSPSWKGKELKAEDTILAVGQGNEDPVDIVDMGLRDAVKLIRGPKGTTVKLTVKKPDNSTMVISIVREEIVIEESYVRSSVIQTKGNDTKVGYIYVPKFYRDFNDKNGRNCTDDVRTEIEKLKKQKVAGIVLDLRNNGGGALEDAKLMSGLFIKDGPIVQVRASNGDHEQLKDTDKKIYFEKPLIVLVNKFSASASEIVAAAMQDYGRAVIVGAEHTHGKGTVQAVIDLDGYVGTMARMYAPLGALKITIQMFYRITGGSTQFAGVTPDIILPDPYSYLDSGEKSMDYAIPYSEVKPVKFEKWNKFNYDIKKLTNQSNKRVKKSPGFNKITESVKYYSKRKDITKKSLNIKDAIAERKDLKAKIESFKNDELNENVVVIPSDKPKNEAQKESQKEFIEGLQKDPVIEESLHIMNDILSAM